MSVISVGIDLGTTNSVVAISQGGRPRVLTARDGSALIPSVVAWDESKQVIVGSAARARRATDPVNTVFSTKRLLGRPYDSEEVRRARERFAFDIKASSDGGVLVKTPKGDLTLPEISALVLREVRRVAEESLGQKVEKAVVTVPANFNELQRTATKLAGQIADLDVIRILNEPTAAALAYGYGRGSRDRIAVYDFGGGTFDVTLLELSGNVFEVLATAGDTFLGGDDVDLALAENLADGLEEAHAVDARADRRIFERLRVAAEEAKIDLSRMEQASIRIKDIPAPGGAGKIDYQARVSRADLETLAAPLVERTIDVCKEALSLAGLKVGDFKSVVLVGGSSRIPLVHRRVAEHFGKAPLTTLPPEQVVAIGAAILAESLSGAGRKRQVTGSHTTARGGMGTGSFEGRAGSSTGSFAAASSAARPAGPGPATARTTFTGLSEPPPPMPDSAGDSVAPPADTRTTGSFEASIPVAPPTPGAFAHARTLVSMDAPAPPGAARSTAGKTLGSDPPPPAHSPGFDEEPTVIGKAASPPSPQVLGGAPEDEFSSLDDLLDQMDESAAAKPAVPPPPAPPRPAQPAVPAPQLPPAGGRTQVMTAIPDAIAAPSAPAATPEPDRMAMTQVPTGRGAPAAPAVPPPVAPATASSSLDTNIFRISNPPPPGAPARASATASSRPPAPLLIDVTPLSLGVETVGGNAEVVIPRNTTIPVEQSRDFATAFDGQESVKLRVCQGESRKFEENQTLGELELLGLRPAPRGEVNISVTFELDVDGTLHVRARDTRTGQETRARITLLGLPSRDAAQQMAEKQRSGR